MCNYLHTKARWKQDDTNEGYLQSTDRKDRDESNLLPFAQVELPDNWYREENDCEIRDDIDGGVGEPDGELIKAGSLLMCPESSHGYTHEDTGEDRPDSVADDNGHCNPVCNLERLGREDASVLEKHRSLGQAE